MLFCLPSGPGADVGRSLILSGGGDTDESRNGEAEPALMPSPTANLFLGCSGVWLSSDTSCITSCSLPPGVRMLSSFSCIRPLLLPTIEPLLPTIDPLSGRLGGGGSRSLLRSCASLRTGFGCQSSLVLFQSAWSPSKDHSCEYVYRPKGRS
jgi:hypothetical protein